MDIISDVKSFSVIRHISTSLVDTFTSSSFLRESSICDISVLFDSLSELDDCDNELQNFLLPSLLKRFFSNVVGLLIEGWLLQTLTLSTVKEETKEDLMSCRKKAVKTQLGKSIVSK